MTAAVAMLARYMLSSYVRPSVRHIGSRKQRPTIAKNSSFLTPKISARRAASQQTAKF